MRVAGHSTCEVLERSYPNGVGFFLYTTRQMKTFSKPSRPGVTGAVRRWVLNEADPERVEMLSRGLGIPLPVARVLVNRGLEDLESVERFLEPTLRDLYPPEMLADMDRATERICSAITSREPMTIYGDYDADGVTSVALLLCFMEEVGAPTIPIIPNRERDGYGLHAELLKRAYSQGSNLVITVDCGSTDAEAIVSAEKMGIQVIVTDHHEIPDHPPPAYAVINPKRPDNQYPYCDLAGVGVAFLLVWALARGLKERGFWKRGEEPSLKRYLDLVALGTVADQVPLLGENRALVKHGLRQMAQDPRPGITALLKVSGSQDRCPSVGMLAFQLAPRLNAPGRIDDARPALELLLADDPHKAQDLAYLLDGMNRKRQQVEEGIFREACVLAEREIEGGSRAIVLAQEAWHAGVLGIVASRMVERYGLPTVLLAIQDDVGKGSARSPEGFHLLENLGKCHTLLQRYGGHAMAAGLRVDAQAVKAFREAFCEQACSVIGDGPADPMLQIDDRLAPDQVTDELVHHLIRLEPHGVGNPEPVFQMDRLEVAQWRLVGRDHLKLFVRKDGIGFDAIGFGLGMTDPECLEGRIRLACLPQLNEWQGRTTIQLKLKDLRPA
jgi:single-stranded-DNA-specific exonuclease